jgi:hypothetical protein
MSYLKREMQSRSLAARGAVSLAGPAGAAAVGRELPSLMPRSVPGSIAAQRHLIDDGMSLVAKYGSPRYEECLWGDG